MMKLAALSLAAAPVLAKAGGRQQLQQQQNPFINAALVDAIRASASPFEVWDPEQNPLRHLGADQLRDLFGVIPDAKHRPSQAEPVGGAARDLPVSFDARIAYPQCKHAVRNQFHCGSCWYVREWLCEHVGSRSCPCARALLIVPQY